MDPTHVHLWINGAGKNLKVKLCSDYMCDIFDAAIIGVNASD